MTPQKPKHKCSDGTGSVASYFTASLLVLVCLGVLVFPVSAITCDMFTFNITTPSTSEGFANYTKPGYNITILKINITNNDVIGTTIDQIKIYGNNTNNSDISNVTLHLTSQTGYVSGWTTQFTASNIIEFKNHGNDEYGFGSLTNESGAYGVYIASGASRVFYLVYTIDGNAVGNHSLDAQAGIISCGIATCQSPNEFNGDPLGNAIIDATPPSINITSPLNNTRTNNLILQINGTSYDALSGLNYTNITIYKSDGSEIINSTRFNYSEGNHSHNWNWTHDFTGEGDGTYIINATTYDNVGWTNETSITIHMSSDCNCTSCEDCMFVIANNTQCSTIYLTENISNESSTCINNPANFNNKIFDCQGHTIDGFDLEYGIHLIGKENNTIKNCTLSGWGIGILMEASHDCNLTNNIIYNNIGDGIRLIGNESASTGPYNQTYNNNLIGNTISNNSNGVHIREESQNNALINNTINKNEKGIVFTDGYGNVGPRNNRIDNNIVNENLGEGIFFYNTYSNNLSDNQVNNNNGSGIMFDRSDHNTLVNNNITNNIDQGVYLDSYSDYNDLVENQICWNKIDINDSDPNKNGQKDNNTCNSWNNWNDSNTEFNCGCTLICPGSDFTVTPFSPPNDKYTNNTKPEFKFNVTGDITRYTCILLINETYEYGSKKVENNTNSNITPGGSGLTEEKTYNWTVNCTYGGKTKSTTIKRNITIDTTYPRIIFSGNTTPQDFVKQNWIYSCANITETNIGTVILFNTSANETVPSPYCKNITGLSNGNYTIWWWINDSAGQSNRTEARWAYLDTAGPSINITQPLNASTCMWYGGTLRGIINVKADVNDTGAGADNNSVYYNVSGVGWTQMTNTSRISFTAELNTTKVTTDGKGEYNLIVKANDTLGNMNDTYITIKIDNQPPKTNATGNDTSWHNTSVTINLSCTDYDGSGCNTTLYCIDSCNTCAPNKEYPIPFNVVEEGAYYIRFASNDSLGNEEEVKNTTVLIDKTLPSFATDYSNKSSSTTPNIICGNRTEINVTITEKNLDTFIFTWNGTTSATCDNTTCDNGIITGTTPTFRFYINETDLNGTYNYTAWANDSAGNQKFSETRTFNTSYCGDGVCTCGENTSSCPNDCRLISNGRGGHSCRDEGETCGNSATIMASGDCCSGLVCTGGVCKKKEVSILPIENEEPGTGTQECASRSDCTPCSGGKVCLGGSCVADDGTCALTPDLCSNVNCSDMDPCTRDSCERSTGKCTHAGIECASDEACVGGACTCRFDCCRDADCGGNGKCAEHECIAEGPATNQTGTEENETREVVEGVQENITTKGADEAYLLVDKEGNPITGNESGITIEGIDRSLYLIQNRGGKLYIVFPEPDTYTFTIKLKEGKGEKKDEGAHPLGIADLLLGAFAVLIFLLLIIFLLRYVIRRRPPEETKGGLSDIETDKDND